MSGTRSPSRAAPATDAAKPVLLIVAHGERGGAGTDRFAHAIADHVGSSGAYAGARVCFISKDPTLEQVYAALPPGPAVIYPLFMSDGYFVSRAIPRSLGYSDIDALSGDRKLQILQPLGLSSWLPSLVADIAAATAEAAGLEARDCTLLLAAHGSRSANASRAATVSVAGTVTRMARFAGVEVAFLEEPPFLDEQVRNIEGPAILVGLFAGEGMHGADDLGAAVRNANRDDLHVAPPLTRSARLLTLVRSTLLS